MVNSKLTFWICCQHQHQHGAMRDRSSPSLTSKVAKQQGQKNTAAWTVSARVPKRTLAPRCMLHVGMLQLAGVQAG